MIFVSVRAREIVLWGLFWVFVLFSTISLLLASLSLPLSLFLPSFLFPSQLFLSPSSVAVVLMVYSHYTTTGWRGRERNTENICFRILSNTCNAWQLQPLFSSCYFFAFFLFNSLHTSPPSLSNMKLWRIFCVILKPVFNKYMKIFDILTERGRNEFLKEYSPLFLLLLFFIVVVMFSLKYWNVLFSLNFVFFLPPTNWEERRRRRSRRKRRPFC